MRARCTMFIVSKQYWTDFLSEFDVLLVPATACTAFPLSDPPRTIGGEASVQHWSRFSPFNLYANLSGQPACNLPAGLSRQGLPLGAMMFAGFGREDRLLAASAAFERAAPWANVNPAGF